MGIAHEAAKTVGKSLKSVHAGDQRLVAWKVAAPTARMVVTSPDFMREGQLPLSATVDGNGIAPTIEWTKPPLETKSIVLVCEDPDAPMPEPYVHWMVYGLAPETRAMDEETSLVSKQGQNSKLAHGFTPAAPPPGHGVHHYHFQVFALDTPLDFESGLGRSALVGYMQGHVLAWGELVGTYERS